VTNQEDFVIPQLYCPFPPEVNPHFEAVHEQTLAWGRQFGLVEDERAIARLRDAKIGSLVARAYSRSPRDPLVILTDLHTWLFILDDECDEAGIGKRPQRLGALHAQCLEVLSGLKPENRPMLSRTRPDAALIQALCDLRCRMDGLMSRARMERFAVSVSEYFEAGVWEAKNREIGVWPNSTTYTPIRPFAGGMYIVLDLIDLTEGDTLPLVVRKDPCYQRLMLIASNVVLWSNDLFSLHKERAHHDMHNLALVLQHEEDINLQAAVDRVAWLIEREVKRFIALEARLPSFGPAVDSLLQRFVGVFRAYMRGNIDWSCETGRYRYAEAQTPSSPKVRDEGASVSPVVVA
jgi:hypothetical protein